MTPNFLLGLHVKKQDLINRIQEKQKELEQLESAQKLVDFKICQSYGGILPSAEESSVTNKSFEDWNNTGIHIFD